MIKFNDSGVIVGFIKELLHSFNLPTTRVYVEGHTPLYDGGVYLKGDEFVVYRKATDSFEELFPYFYNRTENNYTKNLLIKNQLYDAETHEYLGEYLRFLRDYYQLDLMSLYNCFSNNLLNSIKVTVEDSVFETNSTWKVYGIPVKLGQKYSVAVTSDLGVELFCGLYGKDYIELGSQAFEKATYAKEKAANFNKPFIYEKLADVDALPEDEKNIVLAHENALKMFIKIPYQANSSIVVLEGDYRGFNDRCLAIDESEGSGSTNTTSQTITINNSAIINFEDGADHDPDYLKLISGLQLLKLNTKISHPFADRLLEYICGNAITNMDEVSDDIKRLQIALSGIRKANNAGSSKIKTYTKQYGL